MTTTLDPWALVTAAQGGDTTAYGDLWERYRDTVFRFVLTRVRSWTVAEDLTSETFTRGLQRIGSVKDLGRDPGCWFITIARNLIYDHVKSSRFKCEIPTADVYADRRYLGPGPDQEALAGIMGERLSELLADAVAALSPAQQEVIQLRFWDEKNIADVATATGRYPGAVKALQHRAIVALRSRLRGVDRFEYLT